MEKFAQRLLACWRDEPLLRAVRCAQGIGNYVFDLTGARGRYILRCSREPAAYENTVRWLEELAALYIPVPRVLGHGLFEGWACLLLTRLEGEDLGLVYPRLTREEKREIVRLVEAIQRKAAALRVWVPPDWRWQDEVTALLDRAEERIRQNGWFDPEKVTRLRRAARELEDYFSAVPPVAYLDDISSKNLLIHEGRVSGIIDVDWIGVGDRLTYAALTEMALLDLGYDTDYVTFLLEEMAPTPAQLRAFRFYTLLYCVDFMGERGMRFLDKQVPVSPEIVDKLERVFSLLWEDWTNG